MKAIRELINGIIARFASRSLTSATPGEAAHRNEASVPGGAALGHDREDAGAMLTAVRSEVQFFDFTDWPAGTQPVPPNTSIN